MSSFRGDGQQGGSNEDVEADEAVKDAEARLDDRANGHDAYLEEHDDAGSGIRQESYFDEHGLVEQGDLDADNVLPAEYELDEQDVAQLSSEAQLELDDVEPDLGPATPISSSPLASPAESGFASIPDDTPSLRGSLASSPLRGASPISRKPLSRNPSSALQPFERRFESRVPSSQSGSSRVASPGFLSPHSRQISLSSQISQISSQDGDSGSETQQAPWEVIRWTKLRKLAGQAFSEAGKRNFGRPTCIAVSALIAIGTSKGLVLGFDYHQTLKIIIGQGTKATECGSVTALAIAADYSTIASGHANGHIFTWEINRPARPFLQIPPLDPSYLRQSRHSDGHVANFAILHIGFLGTRRTALVSADAGGMAFSHIATRGLGPVTRTVNTTRLLGRYPSANPEAQRNQKPSSVLAFSPLPLGNIEQPTDTMGLTALLTPYLLVIVSTTPIAQTQHKSPRPKEISTHGTLSGCLAWFPAVKLKTPSKGNSDTKLVYCWSNVLTVLDVSIVNAHPDDSQKPPELDFNARSRWRADEAIVAVQWVGRSVLAVLTVSQRLLILEDSTLQVTDTIDLLHRHMYHQDLFSQQLNAVVEQLNSAEPSLHGVVADAFYMSFKTYKGRTFLLGFDDLTVGTLSNWADRLIALMEAGDHIAAIRLATEYYSGSANNVTIGLPDSDAARHEMVKERLVAMVSASLTYTFSQHDKERTSRLQELAEVCFSACITMDETGYLLADVFEQFEEMDETSTFINNLEPYVLEGEITTLPPEVVQALVSYFISENEAARLEEVLFRLDPSSFDLDQVTILCRQHSLYDALIYVWTQGIGDYVTPLIDLLTLVKLQQSSDDDGDLFLSPFFEPAMKVFPYLAYSLTGRRYPKGEIMDSHEASRAKADLYDYIFSGTVMPWPQGTDKTFNTTDRPDDEPAFPYLSMLLHFDTSSFLSMLNEAFEDPFLNHAEDDNTTNGTSHAGARNEHKGFSKSRQQIIEMLDVMRQGNFGPEQIIFLDMFIARSVPKYPGQLILPGYMLSNVLQRLCDPPSDELRDDCQLSIEYLLSIYRPTDITTLINSLKEAQYFRVLKSVYRTERMYTEYMETFFEDHEDKETVFDAISFCFRHDTALTSKQSSAVRDIVKNHVADLADIDIVLTARTIATYAPELMEHSITALSDTQVQFVFLRALLEPALLQDNRFSTSPLSQESRSVLIEHYVQLMCKHDPVHVADYIETLPSSNLRLDQVLPAMEDCGVVDAAVVLLIRDGLARDAMVRLVSHMQNLSNALSGLILEAPAASSIDYQETFVPLLEQIEKYTKVGIWLCQGQSSTTQKQTRPRQNPAWDVREDDLELDEYLWLSLIDVVVQVSQAANKSIATIDTEPSDPTGATATIDLTKITPSLRSNVQQTFTALLAATTIPSPQLSSQSHSPPSSTSFLLILRAFLSRISTTTTTSSSSSSPTPTSLSDLRSVLTDIFSAYTFESSVLHLAHELLGSDLFIDVHSAHTLRQRGWRPRTQACEHCKRRAWGTGVGEKVWEEFSEREKVREEGRMRKELERKGGEGARRLERGKGREEEVGGKGKGKMGGVGKGMGGDGNGEEEGEREEGGEGMEGGGRGGRGFALVVFACRHTFHRVCIDEEYKDGKRKKGGEEEEEEEEGEGEGDKVVGGGGQGRVYRCPICTD